MHLSQDIIAFLGNEKQHQYIHKKTFDQNVPCWSWNQPHTMYKQIHIKTKTAKGVSSIDFPDFQKSLKQCTVS